MCKDLISFIVLLLSVGFSKGDYRDIVLSQGVVRGYDVDANDVISFYGIPYATVPTGNDRFKAPLPPRSWEGILNTTDNNLVCYQGKEFDPAILDAVKVYDCLMINVFIPKETNETNLPVLYHIHGGAFQFGYGNEMLPVGLVSREMIVVNFNHRLGVHGFLCLNTEYAPGNAGMKDMVAALRWVKENIDRFGGDPDNISMSGPSAGSSAAEYIVLSPMSDGLLKRAMLESGSALNHSMVIFDPIILAEQFANQHGVYSNGSIDDLETFYKSLTDEQLKTSFDFDHHHLGFMPCVETHNLEGVESFLVDTPINIINSGNYEIIPIMTGFTSLEGIEFYGTYEIDKLIMEENLAYFIPNQFKTESMEDVLELTDRIRNMYFPTGEITFLDYINFYGDVFVVYPQYASARLHTRNGAPVHLYFFNFNGTINLPNVKLAPIWGPGHVAHSLYIYDYDDKSVYENMNEEDLVVRNKLRDIYYSYCKDGNPNPESLNVDWLKVTVDTVNALHMDTEFYMERIPIQERMEFWDHIFQYDYNNVHASASASVFILSVIAGLINFMYFLSLW